MKKYYFLSLLIALTSFAFIACGSEDDDNNGGSSSGNNSSNVTLPTPRFKTEAKKIVNKKAATQDIQSIELTESGKAIVTSKKEISGISLRPASLAPRRATTIEADLYFYICDFSLKSDGSFDLKGIGTLHLNILGTGIEVTLIVNGDTYVIEADVASAETFNQANDNLCRSWTIDKTRVRFTDGLTAAADFNGCDLNEIAAFVKKYGDFNENFEANHKVVDLTITHSHTYLITYASGKVEIGQWSWKKVSDGQFYYTWANSGMGNDFENGDATITYKDGKGVLTLNGTLLDSSGKAYATGMTHTMTAK